MKAVIVGLVLLAGINVFALSGKTPPASNGSGGVQCAWYDGGKYEEHAPHVSQQDCLNSGHASCEERCFTYTQVCTVEGVHNEYVKDDKGNPVMKNISMNFVGRDQDLWRAQEEAMHDCRMSSVQQDTCRLSSCTEEANRIR